MTIELQYHAEAHIKRGQVRRRDFLQGISFAGAAAGTLGWSDAIKLQAAELRRRGMACILLWMQGGPSQFETFDPKPNHANGGETTAISTSVSGIQIAEHFPQVAKKMEDLAIIRSMTNKEGNHLRATYQLQTGYMPTSALKHPTFGATASYHLAEEHCQLPAFVKIGGRGTAGGGFLGVEHDPFRLQSPDQPPANTAVTTTDSRYRRRLGLLNNLEGDFSAAGAKQAVDDHQKLYKQAAKMVLSPQMKAFDLNEEPSSMHAGYGEGNFAKGCLLARRLVESGVAFVEVNLGNWDTHRNNFESVPRLAAQCDQPFAFLLEDLKQRGMLDKTLVIWMGEFGRTPRINPNSGRDHYPRAFNVVLSGAGIRGGQVIGSTDAGGNSVAERPVGVSDLFRSFCTALQIDPNYEHFTSIGRPIKTVDGGQTIQELFS